MENMVRLFLTMRPYAVSGAIMVSLWLIFFVLRICAVKKESDVLADCSDIALLLCFLTPIILVFLNVYSELISL